MSRSRAVLLISCVYLVAAIAIAQNNSVRVASPDDQLVLTIATGPAQPEPNAPPRARPVEGLRYSVQFHGKPLFENSALGLKLEGQTPLGPGMTLVNQQQGSSDQTYTIPVGKTSSVRDHYNSVRADFQDAQGRKLTVEARAYGDGVAFRYILPGQAAIRNTNIEHELTEFHYSKDASLYPLILDGFQSSYEDEYQVRNVSGLHRDWLIALPLLANVPGTGWVAISEAGIENYAGMYVRKADAPFAVRTELSPRLDKTSIAVQADPPVTTPWRVLMIG